LPVNLDNIVSSEKAKILLYKKNENHNLLEEIRGKYKLHYGKLFVTLKRFCDYGNIKDNDKFKFISDKTYEFRIDNLRVFCVMLEGEIPITIVLYHYYKKQSQKMPKKERDKALKLASDILSLHKEGKLIIK
jgi:phage-related protein